MSKISKVSEPENAPANTSTATKAAAAVEKIEKENITDSPGNRCSYCGTSFEDQIKLANHQAEKHADENKLPETPPVGVK